MDNFSFSLQGLELLRDSPICFEGDTGRGPQGKTKVRGNVTRRKEAAQRSDLVVKEMSRHIHPSPSDTPTFIFGH